MLDPKIFEELAQKMTALLPQELLNARNEVQKQFEQLLHSTFNRLDLVTKEDFEIQTQVLLKSREKIEALEARITALEQKLSEQQ